MLYIQIPSTFSYNIFLLFLYESMQMCRKLFLIFIFIYTFRKMYEQHTISCYILLEHLQRRTFFCECSIILKEIYVFTVRTQKVSIMLRVNIFGK